MKNSNLLLLSCFVYIFLGAFCPRGGGKVAKKDVAVVGSLSQTSSTSVSTDLEKEKAQQGPQPTSSSASDEEKEGTSSGAMPAEKTATDSAGQSGSPSQEEEIEAKDENPSESENVGQKPQAEGLAVPSVKVQPQASAFSAATAQVPTSEPSTQVMKDGEKQVGIWASLSGFWIYVVQKITFLWPTTLLSSRSIPVGVEEKLGSEQEKKSLGQTTSPKDKVQMLDLSEKKSG